MKTELRTGSSRRIHKARGAWRDGLQERGEYNPIIIQQSHVPFSPHSCLMNERHYCNDRECKARVPGNYSVRSEGKVVHHE